MLLDLVDLKLFKTSKVTVLEMQNFKWMGQGLLYIFSI